MTSLYGQYILEREGRQIVEDDNGFATYRFTDDGQIYLIDMYVRPEKRGTNGISPGYVEKVEEIAFEAGCTKMYTTCIPKAKGSTHSLLSMLKNGFMLAEAKENVIILEKIIRKEVQ